uniref:Uncharacterized protein n=1 Tax=Mycena chlorophos TaxID=658473 RepID=A0ABQ0L9J3_MYCCL|nr:predicted protein [Mycena chlorophos]
MVAMAVGKRDKSSSKTQFRSGVVQCVVVARGKAYLVETKVFALCEMRLATSLASGMGVYVAKTNPDTLPLTPLDRMSPEQKQASLEPNPSQTQSATVSLLSQASPGSASSQAQSVLQASTAAVLAYTRINSRRDELAQRLDAPVYTKAELREMGDCVPDFEYTI